MIRVEMTIRELTPSEGDRYPNNKTIANFDVEADATKAFQVFQTSLRALTSPQIDFPWVRQEEVES
jgi:hypothetical protein